MQAMKVLEKYRVPTSSVVKAIQAFGDAARQKSRKTYCNQFIKELGGKLYDDATDAEIIAKALIERVLMDQDEFNVESAIKSAEMRRTQLKERMPELWAMPEIEEVVDGKTIKRSAVTGKRVKEKRDPEKKARALKIYQENKHRPEKDIISIMAKELQITNANASYYVTRAFKKL